MESTDWDEPLVPKLGDMMDTGERIDWEEGEIEYVMNDWAAWAVDADTEPCIAQIVY